MLIVFGEVRREGKNLSASFENILIGLIGIGISGFLGILMVDFCDRKLPKMLGEKPDE